MNPLAHAGRPRPLSSLLLVVACTACVGDPDPGANGADADAGDTAADLALDVGADLAPDPGPDVTPDAPLELDAAPDADAPSATFVFRELPEPAAPPAGVLDDLLAEVGALSPWQNHVRAEVPRPEPGQLGAIGVGNGLVFATTGYGDPVNVLHSAVGPTYERHGAFFGDYALALQLDGSDVAAEREWAARALAAPIAVTAVEAEGASMYTVDLAPPGVACIVRTVALVNSGSAAADVGLRIVPTRAVEPSPADGDAAFVERRDARRLVTRLHTSGVVLVDGLGARAPDVAPGSSARVIISHCADEGTTDGAPDVADPAALARAVVGATARTAAVEVPDPLVQAWIDGMEQTLRVQRSAQGAWCPMSQYTRMWVRDTVGPFRAMLALGDVDAAREMLDYLALGARLAGDFRNSYDADLQRPAELVEPDWDALPPLAGRTAAETPSYLVWMVAELVAATGDVEPARTRWPELRRAMLRQDVDADGLLPFSGDETFRAAMNAAFGLRLEFPHDVDSWSLNSSLLFVAASERFAALADRLGMTQDADEARALGARVLGAVTDRYVLPDGCLSALIDRDTQTAWPAPFEDASLQTTWTGALDPQDPVAVASLRCLLERVARAPGEPLSPAHPRFHGVDVLGGASGAYTGMLPGYALHGLAAALHPDADATASWLGRAADPTGNYQEYLRGSDDTGLQLIYDPIGDVGDYTAKFRPWEGGINLDALLFWLFGLERDGAGIRATPRLPPGWDTMAIRGWMHEGVRWSLVVERLEGGEVAVVVSHDGEATLPAVVRHVAEAGATVTGPSGSPTTVVTTAWGTLLASTQLTVEPLVEVRTSFVVSPDAVAP